MPIKQLYISTKGGEVDQKQPSIRTFAFEDQPKLVKEATIKAFYILMAFIVPVVLVYTYKAILEAL